MTEGDIKQANTGEKRYEDGRGEWIYSQLDNKHIDIYMFICYDMLQGGNGDDINQG